MNLEASFPKSEQLKIPNLEDIISHTIKDMVQGLKVLGIKTPLWQAESVAGEQFSFGKSEDIVAGLDRKTIDKLKMAMSGISLDDPYTVLEKFEEISQKLPAKIAQARRQNVISHLRLRSLRNREDLSEERKKELKDLQSRQVEVAKTLKSHDLEKHLGRLLDYIDDLMGPLQAELQQPTQEITEGEIQKRLENALSISKGSHIQFTKEDVKNLYRLEEEWKRERRQEWLKELESIKDAILEYQSSKN